MNNFTKDVIVKNLLYPQNVTTAQILYSNVVDIAESYCDIIYKIKRTSGSIKMVSVIVSNNDEVDDDDILINGIEVTDLERFTYLEKPIETDLATISTLNIDGFKRIGFASNQINKPYLQIKFATIGSSVNLNISADILLNSFKKIVQ